MNIYQRLHAVMSELTYVSKERENKFDKFVYVGHDDVTEPLHPLFVKHGIFMACTVLECTRADAMLRVRVQLTFSSVGPTISPADDSVHEYHEPAHVTVHSYGEAADNRKDKQGNPKGDDLQIGKAVSYAVKIALLKNFMLVGGNVDDNEKSARDEDPQSSPRAAAPPQREEPAPASDEQVALMVEEYGKFQRGDRAALQKHRVAVGNLVNKGRLTKEQLVVLEKADSEAVKRVSEVAS